MMKYQSNTEMAKHLVRVEKIKKEKEANIQKKNELKGEWAKRKESIMVLENELELVRAKVNFVKDVLKDYYVNLLQQGIDIR
jgi:hypothetical protein